MTTMPFETLSFGDGQATLTVYYDDASLKLVRIDWAVQSGTLTGTLTNTKNGNTRSWTSTQNPTGSLSLPSGKQFPLSQFTNDDGVLETTHGDNTVSVRWNP